MLIEQLPNTIYELLTIQAQHHPNSIALVAPGRRPLSFGALLRQIDTVLMALNSCGLGRGDRIAVLAERGPDTVSAELAVASSAICVPLNPAAPPDELKSSLGQTRAGALMVPVTASIAVKNLAASLDIPLLEYSSAEDSPAGEIHIDGGRHGAAAQPGPAQRGDLAFVLRTSGTTRIKIVPLSHRNMIASADKTRRVLGLVPTDRCLNLMPLCYHHGLNAGLLASLVAGGGVVCPSAFDLESFLSCMRNCSPTWYTAGFAYHQAILEWLEQRPGALNGIHLRFARSGSGPLRTHVETELEQILGAPVLQSYGSSETGAIAANAPDGLRKPGMVGRPLSGDVAIMDEDGRILGSGLAGEVVARGPALFAGYENDPEANQRAFRGEWYRTGDQGVLDNDGYLKLLGRLDEVINRGGEKITPLEVDDALMEHGSVAQAVCFPVPHPRLGHDIAAAVVPRRGMTVTAEQLHQFLAPRLAPFKVPHIILCTAELPKGPTGKFNRANLFNHFGLDVASRDVATAPPPSLIQQTLLALWRDVLRREDIDCNSDFFQFGGDSVSAEDLLLRIEKELQYKVPTSILVEGPTVNRFLRRLESSDFGANDSLVRIRPGGTRRPLFAISGRGGHLLRLQAVLHALGPDQPCYGLQPPGMDWARVECEALPEMAAYYLEQVKAIEPKGPYRLLGASFGGLVVFEMALQLQRQGETVEFLGMLDTNPPGCLSESGIEVEQPAPNAEHHPSRVSESHLQARRHYIVDARLEQNVFHGQLTYFLCQGNPIIAGRDPRRLWLKFAPDEFRLLHLPGLHGHMDLEPQRTALQNLLRACLDGDLLAPLDPTSTFDRTYRIETDDQGERIVSATGDFYRVEPTQAQGFVETIHFESDTIQLSGWATEPNQVQPAKTIVVFFGDRWLGYGASGRIRHDIAKRLGVTSDRHFGFNFVFKRGAINDTNRGPRLYVLSDDHRAAELPVSVEHELTVAQAELGRQRAELERQRTELQRQQAELKQNGVKIRQQRAELSAMKDSTSWRVTAPLRSLRKMISSLFNR